MYITESTELSNWMDRASLDGRYGIDIEFIRERTYYPQLALIQISVGSDLALLDPLGDVDLSPLIATVDDPAIIKVVHAGSQDLEILENLSGSIPRAVFDTQIASAFIGLGLQPSYAATCGQLLDVVVEKGESWTDWLRRPLTQAQEIYALDDVRHLLPLHDVLVSQLEKEGRLPWALDEMKKYERDTTYHPPLDVQVRKVKRSGTLKERGLGLLGELFRWREDEAQKKDRPRRRIISDEVLVEVARRSPPDEDGLRKIRGLDPRDLRRHGTGLLAAVARGNAIEEGDLPVILRRRRLEPQEEAAVELATSALRALCRAKRIAPPLVARGDDVESLVRDHYGSCLVAADHNLLHGWRGELFGESLIGFLEGKFQLGFDVESGFPDLRPSR
ncbi:MAG: ribonuclease D [Planctomycetota bacterium]|nr:MAG: ribonuclease D [Planctomycetota bacterium]